MAPVGGLIVQKFPVTVGYSTLVMLWNCFLFLAWIFCLHRVLNDDKEDVPYTCNVIENFVQTRNLSKSSFKSHQISWKACEKLLVIIA